VRRALGLAVLVALACVSGCASSTQHQYDKEVQRATEGPSADEVFASRFAKGYGRPPSFDESNAFRDDLDQRTTEYLVQHPDLSVSPRASQFTFHRRIAVGMTKEEVVLLGGTPSGTTQDEAAMQEAARTFWPDIKDHANEMWTYPGGWQLYFEGDRLADLTVLGKAPLSGSPGR